jgi:hypothetical protein
MDQAGCTIAGRIDCPLPRLGVSTLHLQAPGCYDQAVLLDRQPNLNTVDLETVSKLAYSVTPAPNSRRENRRQP